MMTTTTIRLAASGMLLALIGFAEARDWPEWRGPNREARAIDFKVPAAWPKELNKKWSVSVGDGVATPALVEGKLYVFTRQDGNEILRCLDAESGKELWQDSYAAKGATGAARNFAGPRASPTVAEGKVITLGANGTLSCLDAASGKVVWRKDDYQGQVPRFFTSSSPIVVSGLCVAQLGGENEGAIVAFDLADGSEKWKWTQDGTAYASPVVATMAGTKAIVAETNDHIVALNIPDGKLLWETPFSVGRGRAYNACTPVIDGQTIIFSGVGRGTRAVRIEKRDGKFESKELWSNPEFGVQFNTPVVKNGLVFGISDRDKLFCINEETGKTAWSIDVRGNRGYGSIIDARSVLFALTPKSELIVFEPTSKEFKQIASYKVASSDVYAYPVVAVNRIYIKDKGAVTLWTVE